MYNKLMSWLASGSTAPFMYANQFFRRIFVRIQRDDQVEYLFCQAGGDGRLRREKLEYIGLYCRKDGLLYDAAPSVFKGSLVWSDLCIRTGPALLEQMRDEVRAKVEEKVGNDRRNLTVSKLSNPWLKSELQGVAEYGARDAARIIYLDNLASEQLKQRISHTNGEVHTHFHCDYHPEGWTEDEMLSYIMERDAFVEKKTEKYMSEHQEDILLQFLANDLLKKEYEALLVDKENPVHLIRRIMATMKSTTAKTVNITINKDGAELTMKVDADCLRRDPGFSYGTWDIAAQDRKRFENLFGRNANYGPENIFCIKSLIWLFLRRQILCVLSVM